MSPRLTTDEIGVFKKELNTEWHGDYAAKKIAYCVAMYARFEWKDAWRTARTERGDPESLSRRFFPPNPAILALAREILESREKAAV